MTSKLLARRSRTGRLAPRRGTEPTGRVTRSRPLGGRRQGRAGLTLDQALVALFIGAMNANGHVAPSEAARAHHLIWSTRRFRRKSGDVVGRIIEDMRTLLEERGETAVIPLAVAAVPARLRAPAFAVVADLLLADGKMDAQERRFLSRLGVQLALGGSVAARIVEAMLIKNQL